MDGTRFRRINAVGPHNQVSSLVLDNWWNLGLTFDLSVWIRKCGPIQVFEQDEVHSDEGGHEMVMIKLNLEKKKERNKNQKDHGKGIW